MEMSLIISSGSHLKGAIPSDAIQKGEERQNMNKYWQKNTSLSKLACKPKLWNEKEERILIITDKKILQQGY